VRLRGEEPGLNWRLVKRSEGVLRPGSPQRGGFGRRDRAPSAVAQTLLLDWGADRIEDAVRGGFFSDDGKRLQVAPIGRQRCFHALAMSLVPLRIFRQVKERPPSGSPCNTWNMRGLLIVVSIRR